MDNAKKTALKTYPVRKDGRKRYYNCTDDDVRKLYAQGYRKAEKDIISLIESRIGEIMGDAQPAPVLRIELRELIKRIKEGE